MLKKCKPFEVDIFTKTISENVIHDKCDKECFIWSVRGSLAQSTAGPRVSDLRNETQKSLFEMDHDCKVNDNVVEPSLECIRDCADVKYVCNCNVYRYRSNI